MHLYLDIWKARSAWVALSEAQRREILLKLQRHIDDVVDDGAGRPRFSLNHDTWGSNDLHRYQILWEGAEPRHIEGMRRVFEEVMWERYFERIGTTGESIDQTELFEELSTLGEKAEASRRGSGLARGIAGWFSRLARIFRSRDDDEEKRAAPLPPRIPPPVDEPDDDEVEETGSSPTRDEGKGTMLRVERSVRFTSKAHPWFDIDAYLERIGYTGATTPDIRALRGLHRAHLLHVPFENLALHSNESIVLNEERFFQKIVRRRRGGVCYELNGLFALLLEGLGFRVQRLSASVAHEKGFGPEFEHMPLMVRLNERWLVDVGFGETFLEPIDIDITGDQRVGGEIYRVDRDGEYRTLRRRGEEYLWNDIYRFTLLPRVLGDFAQMCDYHQTSPSSHFTHSRLCSIATGQGRVTLVDNRLISTKDGERSIRALSTLQDIAEALRTEFGIAEDTWGTGSKTGFRGP